jgi:hypothetical protein
MKAWLVTWDWMGDHALVENRIAAILNPRMSAGNVRNLVEFLYANFTFSLDEKIKYANNRRFNPFPAQFGLLNGIPWEGYIHCGDNPWLFARKVSDIRLIDNGMVEEQLVWKEDSEEVIKALRRQNLRNR